MAYDVHITRTKVWFQSKTNPIPMSDWSNYVQNDPSLHFVNVIISGTKPVVSYINEGLAVWIKDLIEDEKNFVYFDYVHGRVVAKNPDEATVDKLRKIAENLDAFVIGDEGEEY